MTTDEILNLPSGRELDALVAEKGMEWQWWHDTLRDYAILVPPNQQWPARERFNLQPGKGNAEKLDVGDVPSFSFSIAAAWLVAEKLGLSVIHSEDGWYAIKPTDIWHERFDFTDKNCIRLIGEDGEIFFPSDTAPLAIIRCALAAVAALKACAR